MLNHSLVLLWLESKLATPGTLFGRSYPWPVLDWSLPALTFSGNPLETVTMLLSSHPPIRPAARPRVKYLLPLPTGKSYRTEVTKRCRVSKIDKPRSQLTHRPFCGLS